MMTVFSQTATILAHQGGWDEVLLIGVPIVAIVVALRIAKKRVDAAVVAPAADPSNSFNTSTPSPSSPSSSSVDTGDEQAS